MSKHSSSSSNRRGIIKKVLLLPREVGQWQVEGRTCRPRTALWTFMQICCTAKWTSLMAGSCSRPGGTWGRIFEGCHNFMFYAEFSWRFCWTDFQQSFHFKKSFNFVGSMPFLDSSAIFQLFWQKHKNICKIAFFKAFLRWLVDKTMTVRKAISEIDFPPKTPHIFSSQHIPTGIGFCTFPRCTPSSSTNYRQFGQAPSGEKPFQRKPPSSPSKDVPFPFNLPLVYGDA